MLKNSLTLLLLAAMLLLPGGGLLAQDASKRKKLIEWGWDELLLLVLSSAVAENEAQPATVPRVQVAQDNRSFVLHPSGRPFIPWGFNYDHDEKGRLLEDYWDKEWPKVEADFQEMKQLGANVVRIHLQVGKFMTGPDKPNEANLDRLGRLVALAEQARPVPRHHRTGLLPQEGRARMVRPPRRTAAVGCPGPVLGGGGRAMCQEPGHLLLRSDERAGRAGRHEESPATGWGRPSWGATPVTSSSSSRWNRKTVLGPTSPASGVTSWWRPFASTTSVIWSPSGWSLGAWIGRA